MVSERLQKEQQRLENLKQQKEVLETKIQKKESLIRDLENLSKQKQFDTAQEVLYISGYTLEEVLALARSGKLSQLKSGSKNEEMEDGLKKYD